MVDILPIGNVVGLKNGVSDYNRAPLYNKDGVIGYF